MKRRGFRDNPVLNALRKKILKENHFKCHYCGKQAYQIDHKVPMAFGGEDIEDNLVSCCRSCNTLKCTMSYAIFKHEKLWLVTCKTERRKLLRKANKKSCHVFNKSTAICGHGRNRKWCTACRYAK